MRRRPKPEVIAHYEGQIAAMKMLLGMKFKSMRRLRRFVEVHIEFVEGLKTIAKEER